MNDDSNIELPKRIDEGSNPPENNENSTQMKDNIDSSPEANIAFPTEMKNNQDSIDNMPEKHPKDETNTFDQNINSNLSDEKPKGESLFEPIANIENAELSLNENKIDGEAIANTQETVAETVIPTIDEKSKGLEEPLINNDTASQAQNFPTIDDNNRQLNKKVVSVEPIKKEKSKGNLIIAFFALLIILGIILSAFYYFVKMDYIILPENIKNKMPFLSTTTTSTTTTTTTTTNINNNDFDYDEISIIGEYTENTPLVCPDIKAKLILNEDNTFTYNLLSFNEENNNCNVSEITGNYTAIDGNLELIPTDNSLIIGTASYQKVENTVKINIVSEDKTVTLSNSN